MLRTLESLWRDMLHEARYSTVIRDLQAFTIESTGKRE
jgi:hypothetical protein